MQRRALLPTTLASSLPCTHIYSILILRRSSRTLLHRPSEATARVRERRGEGGEIERTCVTIGRRQDEHVAE